MNEGEPASSRAAIHDGIEYGWQQGGPYPPALAALLADSIGSTTTFDRPIRDDPESAYWVARERLWGRGWDKKLLWDYEEEPWDGVVNSG